MSWDKNHWQYTIQGCSEEFPSFWKTVVTSPQWARWEKQVSKNFSRASRLHAAGKHEDAFKNANVWDIDECRECGWISQRHFQAFLKFCTTRRRKVRP